MPPKKSGPKKGAGGTGTSTPLEDEPPSLSSQLSYLHAPRPFKNPNYTKNVNRRARNLKAVLAAEREREREKRESRRSTNAANKNGEEGAEGMEVDGDGSRAQEDGKEWEEEPTYTSVEAPPSLLPPGHYCDITGLEGPYTDPVTGLRYHDKSVYELIKGLGPAAARDYLAARGVVSAVK